MHNRLFRRYSVYCLYLMKCNNRLNMSLMASPYLSICPHVTNAGKICMKSLHMNTKEHRYNVGVEAQIQYPHYKRSALQVKLTFSLSNFGTLILCIFMQ
jgi:hypothetical protein